MAVVEEVKFWEGHGMQGREEEVVGWERTKSGAWVGAEGRWESPQEGPVAIPAGSALGTDHLQ